MQLLLALLMTIPLSLRQVRCYAKEFPLHSDIRKTERNCSSTTLNYEEPRKSKREEKTIPGFPIPLSEKDKIEIVNEHNKYRGQVDPPAADMRYMRYSEDVAYAAQLWANKCVFRHGRPSVTKFQNAVGQNIYKGINGSLSFYISLWHNEVRDFDMKLERCNGSKCGHYLQVVWGQSFLIGCGLSRCVGRKGDFNLFVCHYYKPYESNHPYQVGRPCSLCEEEAGGFCYNNMCVSKEECEKEGWPCECNLKCHNCGVLDEATCTCKCPPGWDFQDCSQKCTDENGWCGKEDGYQGWIGCEMEEGHVKTYFCRKMCGTCEVITETTKRQACCGGNLCDTGYVLDNNNNCSCQLLCPGPECFTDKDAGNAFRGTNSILIVTMVAIYVSSR